MTEFIGLQFNNCVGSSDRDRQSKLASASSLMLSIATILLFCATNAMAAESSNTASAQVAKPKIVASSPQFSDSIEQRVKACVACHGAEGRSTNSGYFPRIAGKPAGYLFNQLKNFRERKRTYPMMNYMVEHLSDAYLQEIANYFADQHPPYAAPAPSNASATVLERGKSLVMQGDPQRHLPACVACHGRAMTGMAPFVPGLLGLPRDYLVGQLGAWQTGNRKAYAPDCMAQIAQKLRADDVEAISSWLSNQMVPSDLSQHLESNKSDSKKEAWPMQCGSIKP